MGADRRENQLRRGERSTRIEGHRGRRVHHDPIEEPRIAGGGWDMQPLNGPGETQFNARTPHPTAIRKPEIGMRSYQPEVRDGCLTNDLLERQFLSKKLGKVWRVNARCCDIAVAQLQDRLAQICLGVHIEQQDTLAARCKPQCDPACRRRLAHPAFVVGDGEYPRAAASMALSDAMLAAEEIRGELHALVGGVIVA